ncbi:MAG: LVIVD repeat-containing protein [Gaiellaceae bacterium]
MALAALVGTLVVLTPGASAVPPEVEEATSTYVYTQNMHPQGFSPFANTPNLPGLTFTANSDLAFWGKLAFQGHYEGFRILNIAAPARPKQISFTECFGNQGDVVVWGDILIRSWNSPATGTGSSQLSCDGEPVALGFEGVHIFDISNLEDPELVGSLAMPCGSHTATVAPDLANDRLVVYNQTSGGPCPFITIFEVPLDDPGSASIIRTEPLEEADACHDSAVILGDVMKLACASHDHANVYSIGGAGGGSLEDPAFLYTVSEPGVCNEPGNPLCNGNWHSAGFTWDGEVLILGWEPGGGAAPECEATDPDVKKSWFFYDADDGSKLGQFVLPRPQTATENCTIHNYNVVPTKKGYVLVGGNYQAGISVVDFTDPANAKEIAFADPAPLVPTQLGGDWSTYWYNGRIYESDITRGLLVWRLSDKAVASARRLDHLNPQTLETSFEMQR